MPFETIVRPIPALAAILAEEATNLARAATSEGRCFALVLPGGSVAEAFFPTLAVASINWRRVECFWSDERSVSPDDPRSNYRLATRLLFNHASVDRTRVHRMPAEAVDLDRAAETYEAELRTVLGPSPRFDMVLLGVGADGHICSLFPGHPALDEPARLVLAVTDSPKPPSRRLTLTLPALSGASLVVVAAFGREKAPVVREALTDPQSGLPVARAARAGRRSLALLDSQAAGHHP
jgi:6-phosphogluconolactonase